MILIRCPEICGHSAALARRIQAALFPRTCSTANGELHYRVSWKFREIGLRNGLRGLFDIVRQIDSRVSFNDRLSLRPSASFSFDAMVGSWLDEITISSGRD